MIISHKYKIIYIRNLKVGGQSFERTLVKYANLTNCCYPYPVISKTQYNKFQSYFVFYLVSLCNFRFPAHANAGDIKDKISPKIWNDYLKIASIRCPYDMVISFYFYMKRLYLKTGEGHFNKFEDFILSYKGSQKTWPAFLFNPMHLDGKIAADFLIRYEHLDEDIKKLENKINCLGLLDTFKNIRLNTKYRPKGTEPWAMYSKYPEAKLAIDKMLYKQQDNYEFLRKYWPIYKAELEKNIARYEQGNMNAPD